MIKKIVTNGLAMIVLLNCALAAGLTYQKSTENLLALSMMGSIGLVSLVFIVVSYALSVSEIDELEKTVVDLKIKISEARTPDPASPSTYTQARKGGLNRRPLRPMDPDL